MFRLVAIFKELTIKQLKTHSSKKKNIFCCEF